MRYEQIIPATPTEEQSLMEVKMSPGALKKFIDSPEARGIRAGFEAEMIFPGLAEPSGDYETEEDFGSDRRARNIYQVMDFFRHDSHNSHREIEALGDWLTEKYTEWVDDALNEKWREDGEEWFSNWYKEQRYDGFGIQDQLEVAKNLMVEDGIDEAEAEAAAEAYLNIRGDATGQEQQQISQVIEYLDQANAIVDEEIQDAWSDRGRRYSEAYEQWREEAEENYSESDFFQDMNMDWMQYVMERYVGETASSLNWPYWTEVDYNEGGYSYGNAEDLARSLSRAVGMRAVANYDYHSGRPEATWVIEPDASLSGNDEDDMPAEIISPPMEIKACLQKLRDFMRWASTHDAYTNQSTGFHVGVSLPLGRGQQKRNIDYVKLALFLGDKYVLESFGRASNHYTESAIKIIGRRIEDGEADVDQAFSMMRKNLLELAQFAIREGKTDKYESINIKRDYIEFRSMGNYDYHRDVDRLTDIVSRYAYAMHIAGDDELERSEYYKKLYKLLSANQKNDDIIRLFSEYSTGAISKQELKIKWAERVHREIAKNTAATRQQGSQLRGQALSRLYDTLPKYYYRLSTGYYGQYNDPIIQGVSADDAYARAVKANPKLAVPRRRRHLQQVFPFMVKYLGVNDNKFQGHHVSREEYYDEYPPESMNYPEMTVWATDNGDARNIYKHLTDMPTRVNFFAIFDIQQLSRPTSDQEDDVISS